MKSYSMPLAEIIQHFYGISLGIYDYNCVLYFKNKECEKRFRSYSINNRIDDIIFVEDVFDLEKSDNYIVHILYAYSDGNIFRKPFTKPLDCNISDLLFSTLFHSTGDLDLVRMLPYIVKLIPDESLFELVDALYTKLGFYHIKTCVMKLLGNRSSIVKNYIKMKYTV